MNNNTTQDKRAILTTKKYRPSLSLTSLKHILRLAHGTYDVRDKEDRHTPESKEQSDKSKELIRTLTPFISKIEVGAIDAAYNVDATNDMSLEDKLGMGEDMYSKEVLNKPTNLNLHDRKRYWKECYDRSKAGEKLTPVEMEAVDEHRFLEGMMTEKEEDSFIDND